VILVRQFRYAALEHGNAWMVEVVAGLIDAGESPEAAIRREAVEEGRYDVGKLEPIATFYTTPGFSSERIALFYGETKAPNRPRRAAVSPRKVRTSRFWKSPRRSVCDGRPWRDRRRQNPHRAAVAEAEAPATLAVTSRVQGCTRAGHSWPSADLMP